MTNPPVCDILKLDQRKLPAEVFERVSHRAGLLKERERKARLAWENFGKPGRDPQKVGNIFGLIATQGKWTPHLKIAQMQNHWDQVVGRENAMHTYPVSLRDGILTIRCDSPAWTTTMNYMIPELTRIIRRKTRRTDHQRGAGDGPTAAVIQPWADFSAYPLLNLRWFHAHRGGAFPAFHEQAAKSALFRGIVPLLRCPPP